MQHPIHHIRVEHDDESATVTVNFSYEVAAAVVAAGYAIDSAEERIGETVFGSDVDRQAFFALVSALKLPFDLEEILMDGS